MVTIEEEDRLKRELLGLFGHMTRMRRELASLHGESTQNFATMADTLDAIVENTEVASNTILESMEEIDAQLTALRATADDATKAICDKITDRVNQVFEACSFQDLTGQRITRVVNALKFVEEKVNSMIRVWGKDELARVFEDIQREMEAAASRQVDADKALLHGPQRTNVAISQTDIDKMFNQDDIDKLFG
jgi:chemotaxis protein CheZ